MQQPMRLLERAPTGSAPERPGADSAPPRSPKSVTEKDRFYASLALHLLAALVPYAALASGYTFCFWVSLPLPAWSVYSWCCFLREDIPEIGGLLRALTKLVEKAASRLGGGSKKTTRRQATKRKDEGADGSH